MKNNVNRLYYLTAILLLTCSFVNKPLSAEAPAKTPEYTGKIIPYGGAYLFFAGKYGGEITKNELAGQTEVKVEGCAKGSRIFQFTLTITQGRKSSVLTSDSNTLTSDMRKRLDSLSKGDSFEFQHTKAYLPNNKDVVDVRGGKFIIV